MIEKINKKGLETQEPYFQYYCEGKRIQKRVPKKYWNDKYQWTENFLNQCQVATESNLTDTQPEQSKIIIDPCKQHIDLLESCINPETRTSTKLTYKHNIETYRKFLIESKIESVTTKEKANEFKIWLLKRKLAHTTVKNYLIVLNTLFKTAIKLELLKKNPFENISCKSSESKYHKLYTEEHANIILEKVKKTNTRLFAAILLIGCYAIRPGELEQLTAEDINFKQGCIRLRTEVSKTKREHLIKIREDDYELIKSLKHRKNNTLFYSKVYLRTMFRQIRKELELEGRGYTLYGFKHYGASSLYEQTNNPELIRGLCRHTNIAVTQAYIREKLTHDHNTIIRAPIA